jgi:Fe-S-cluster containining protein
MKTFVSGNLDCAGCRLCCQNEIVEVRPDEHPENYETEPHPSKEGWRMLAHAENKDCVYLGEKGCTIYDRRLRLCREFDCRVLALKIRSKNQAKLYRCEDVWQRGRNRLHATIQP